MPNLVPNNYAARSTRKLVAATLVNCPISTTIASFPHTRAYIKYFLTGCMPESYKKIPSFQRVKENFKKNSGSFFN